MKRRLALSAALALLALAARPALALPKQEGPARTRQSMTSPPLRLTTLPDLRVDEAWIGLFGGSSGSYPAVPADKVVKGVKVYVVCRFTNAGGGALAGYPSRPNTTVDYLVDGQMVKSSDYWGYLPAGDSVTMAWDYTPTAVGPHTYRCVIDAGKKIGEMNENNNVKEMPFTVVATGSYGTGVILKVTGLLIDDAAGSIQATVENTGTPMTADATVRISIDNVPAKDCPWPKALSKTVCTKIAFGPTDQPGQRTCEWGRQSHEVQVSISGGGYSSDTSGRTKKGTLLARQDLAPAGLVRTSPTRGRAVIANRGSCNSTTWSLRVLPQHTLRVQTIGPFASVKRGEAAHVDVDLDPSSQSARLEVLPTNPEYEIRQDNNVYTGPVPAAPISYDLMVQEIKARGELPGLLSPPDSDDAWKIVPVIENIGDVNPDKLSGWFRFETLVDGVSSGERTCDPNGWSPHEKNWTAMLNACWGPLSVLPQGTHAVTVRIHATGDVNAANDSLTRTMTRP
ncbi:MAG: CARDB domain-containing protein [Candidatus Geothermincolia bacterium]